FETDIAELARDADRLPGVIPGLLVCAGKLFGLAEHEQEVGAIEARQARLGQSFLTQGNRRLERTAHPQDRPRGTESTSGDRTVAPRDRATEGGDQVVELAHGPPSARRTVRAV